MALVTTHLLCACLFGVGAVSPLFVHYGFQSMRRHAHYQSVGLLQVPLSTVICLLFFDRNAFWKRSHFSVIRSNPLLRLSVMIWSLSLLMIPLFIYFMVTVHGVDAFDFRHRLILHSLKVFGALNMSMSKIWKLLFTAEQLVDTKKVLIPRDGSLNVFHSVFDSLKYQFPNHNLFSLQPVAWSPVTGSIPIRSLNTNSTGNGHRFCCSVRSISVSSRWPSFLYRCSGPIPYRWNTGHSL